MVAKEEEKFWPYPEQKIKWAWGERAVLPRG